MYSLLESWISDSKIYFSSTKSFTSLGIDLFFDEVINILFYIAEADGNISDAELNMIDDISKIFGLNQTQFNSLKESRKSSDKLNPYVVLESNPEDNIADIRKKYIKLSKEHHPDLLLSKGVPSEVIEESKKKMRAINLAWNQIQKLKTN